MSWQSSVTSHVTARTIRIILTENWPTWRYLHSSQTGTPPNSPNVTRRWNVKSERVWRLESKFCDTPQNFRFIDRRTLIISRQNTRKIHTPIATILSPFVLHCLCYESISLLRLKNKNVSSYHHFPVYLTQNGESVLFFRSLARTQREALVWWDSKARRALLKSETGIIIRAS